MEQTHGTDPSLVPPAPSRQRRSNRGAGDTDGTATGIQDGNGCRSPANSGPPAGPAAASPAASPPLPLVPNGSQGRTGHDPTGDDPVSADPDCRTPATRAREPPVPATQQQRSSEVPGSALEADPGIQPRGVVVELDGFHPEHMRKRPSRPIEAYVENMVVAYCRALEKHHGFQLAPAEVSERDRGAMYAWAKKYGEHTGEETARYVEEWVKTLDHWAMKHGGWRLRNFPQAFPRLRAQARATPRAASRNRGCLPGDHASEDGLLTPEGRIR
jgi:hypothetical protein